VMGGRRLAETHGVLRMGFFFRGLLRKNGTRRRKQKKKWHRLTRTADESGATKH
jgi:hypothetical protein